MIKVEEKHIALVDTKDVVDGLGDYLATYIKLYNDTVATYNWIKDKIDTTRQREWLATIDSLKVIVLALQAGFSPATPPRNWASGQLERYLAPIPGEVRQQIDKAIPIFGPARIIIFDPNTEHFERPKKTDPICTGFVDLADMRHHFLVGHWDLSADLKFLENGSALNVSTNAVRTLIDLTRNEPIEPTEALPPNPDWRRHIVAEPVRTHEWTTPMGDIISRFNTMTTQQTSPIRSKLWQARMIGASYTAR